MSIWMSIQAKPKLSLAFTQQGYLFVRSIPESHSLALFIWQHKLCHQIFLSCKAALPACFSFSEANHIHRLTCKTTYLPLICRFVIWCVIYLSNLSTHRPRVSRWSLSTTYLGVINFKVPSQQTWSGLCVASTRCSTGWWLSCAYVKIWWNEPSCSRSSSRLLQCKSWLYAVKSKPWFDDVHGSQTMKPNGWWSSLDFSSCVTIWLTYVGF